MNRRIALALCIGTAIATASGVGSASSAERFVDNGNGTISDLQTGLQWEQKVDGEWCATQCARLVEDRFDPCTRCWNALFSWTGSGRHLPDGTVFTIFLPTLNACARSKLDSGPGFAGHCDWRLPSIDELETIVDPRAPGCGDDVHACIPPIFGPTEPRSYVTLTIEPGGRSIDQVWFVDFGDGVSGAADQSYEYSVRAVRTIRQDEMPSRPPARLPVRRASEVDGRNRNN